MLRDRIYTKAVAWLKVLLPLLALVLLSTMFLLARDSKPSLDLTFLDVFDQNNNVQERLNAPIYSGVTSNGDELTMVAREAQPQGEGLTKAFEVRANLIFDSGENIVLTSPTALLREEEDSVLLDGGVRFDSSTGYILDTQTMTASTERTEAESHGPVHGFGPKGTLDAGKMEISPVGPDEDVQIIFTEGVRMVYLRSTEEKDTE
ncbi:MAG: hypothetical protein N4A70_21165 [Pelagimonas sp.]|nr:hypothetical protein [Pelagimonas sp.]